MPESIQPRSVAFPNLIQTTFDLADRVLPVIRRMRSETKPTAIRGFALEAAIGSAFCFAAYLVAKFCEEFAKELGKKAAGKLTEASSAEAATPEAALKQLNVTIVEMQTVVMASPDPRKLQLAVDGAVEKVKAALISAGMTPLDAAQLAGAVGDTLGSQLHP